MRTSRIAVAPCVALLLALSTTTASSAAPGPGPSGSADDYGRQLHDVRTINQTNAWAVGAITDYSSGIDQPLAVHWNGSTWKQAPVPLPEGAVGGSLAALGGSGPDDLWSVGSYQTPSSFGALVEHWDGESWSLLTSPAPAVLTDVRVFAANDVWATGNVVGSANSLILHWNGTAWEEMSGSPTERLLLTIAGSTPNDLWVAGTHAFLEHYDGSAWTLATPPQPGRRQGFIDSFDALSDISATDVWAVGYESKYRKGEISRDLVEHWDGSAWSVVPTPDLSQVSRWQRVNGVSALSGGDAWISGTYQDDHGVGRAMLLHWDGSTWRLTTAPKNPQSVGLDGIFAKGPSDVWAVGDGDHYFALHYHWDGHSWTRF